MEPSPYLPTSRRFVNPLYLRVEAIPEYADLPKRERGPRGLRAELHAPRGEARRDRPRRAHGRPSARRSNSCTGSSGRRAANSPTRAFRAREGAALEDFATWCALAERHGADWHDWPESLRHPGATGSQSSSQKHSDRSRFPSLAAVAARRATRRRAVRGDPRRHGAGDHARSRGRGASRRRRRLGACRTCWRSASPRAHRPTSTTSSGQDWSQPPWRPDQLDEREYQPFRELIAAVLRHAGGVRIDHIIGLFRLWWIPEGAPPPRAPTCATTTRR